MKTILFIGLMCFSVSSLANDEHKLEVDMLNYGVDNCTLTKTEIYHGEIIKGSIPPYLPNTGVTFHFKIGLTKVSTHAGAYTDAEVKLTYKCGSTKHFTIYMKQYYKKDHHHGQMIVEMTNSLDAHETHEVSAPERSMGPWSNYNTQKSGHVRWTFWN